MKQFTNGETGRRMLSQNKNNEFKNNVSFRVTQTYVIMLLTTDQSTTLFTLLIHKIPQIFIINRIVDEVYFSSFIRCCVGERSLVNAGLCAGWQRGFYDSKEIYI